MNVKCIKVNSIKTNDYFKQNPSDENLFNLAKQKAKRIYNRREKQKLSSLSKSNSRKFWKYVNTYRSNRKQIII